MTELTALKAAIDEALRLADDARAVVAICAACAAELPADGTAVTIMASDAQRETIYASDDVIAAFEQAEYALGEGPSLQAFTNGRPTLVPSLSDISSVARWPTLVTETGALPIRAVFCFPLQFGVISVGVLTFYRSAAGPLSTPDLSLVLRSLELTTLALLEARGGDATQFLLGRWLAVDGVARQHVHQATGMLMGQFGISAEAAFARLRAHAFAEERDIEKVARDIVDRRLRLEPDSQ